MYPTIRPNTQHRVSRRHLALAATALLSLSAVACRADTATEELSAARTDETIATTTSTESATATSNVLDATAVDFSDDADPALTDDEIAGLLWIREEEQLAHDVYTTLGAIWNVRIFENIASSEQSHVNATLAVLENYGIDDPAAGNELGTFTDPQIQALHDELMADGTNSLVAALEVGALIEELDITDLRLRSAATDVADLARLYSQLEKGSRNHLRAFTSQLESRDVVYVPTQLDAGDYQDIVSSPNERGHDA